MQRTGGSNPPHPFLSYNVYSNGFNSPSMVGINSVTVG
jgi:hypothetical protein